MHLQVAADPAGPCTVVRLTGQLDFDSAPLLRDELDRLTAQPAPRLVLDMAGLTFCDSIGLSALVLAGRCCEQDGGFLRLAAPTEFVVRLLTVVGVCDCLPVYASVADALRTANGSPPDGRAPVTLTD